MTLSREKADGLFLALMALTVLDLVLSLHLFNTYPGLEEANPVLKAALDVSDAAFVAVKMLFGAGGITLLRYHVGNGSRFASYALVGDAVVMSAVCAVSFAGWIWLSMPVVGVE